MTPVLPAVSGILERARAEGALLDLDKHDWPWAMALPPLMGVQLYELANNHIWRTKFGFTNWNTSVPPHLRPPLGGRSGGEREWILYTLGNYYTLLNAGLLAIAWRRAWGLLMTVCTSIRTSFRVGSGSALRLRAACR